MLNYLLRRANSCRTSVFLLIAITGLSAIPALSQTTSEATEKLRALGITKYMKELPASLTPGMHYTMQVPSNFPIEIYRSNVLSTTFMNSTKGAASAVVATLTKDQPEIVSRWYLAALQRGGWRTQVANLQDLNKGGSQKPTYMFHGTKDIQCCTITITSNPAGQGSCISVNWYVARK